jgi:hypothetical protein
MHFSSIPPVLTCRNKLVLYAEELLACRPTPKLEDYPSLMELRRCIQKFPDWPSGARTANGTALCHYVQLYRYFVSQSSEFWPPIQWVLGALSLGVKLPGREANHSPPSSAEVKE